MAEVFNIFYEVKANVSEAVASFGMVDKELAKMQKSGEITSTTMLKMEKASKLAGIALIGVGGAFASVAAVSIKAAIEVQGAQAKLATAVKDTGVSFDAFKPYMDSTVESMAKLNFTAGDTMTALAQLTAATRSPQKAIDMIGVTADLAAFQHETLAQAADTVSRAAMGQARGLGDLGIALGKTIPKGATVAQIMKAIEDRTRGAASAAAKADPWKQLTVQLGLLEEKLGTALLPSFKKFSDWIINTGFPALEKFGKWISDNKGLVETLTGALAAIWVAPKAAALFALLEKLTAAFALLGTTAATTAGEEAAATGAAATGAAAAAGTAAKVGLGARALGVLGGLGVGLFGTSQDLLPAITGGATQMAKGSYPRGGGKAISGNSSIQGADNLAALLKANAKSTTVNQVVYVSANNLSQLSNQLAGVAKHGKPIGGDR